MRTFCFGCCDVSVTSAAMWSPRLTLISLGRALSIYCEDGLKTIINGQGWCPKISQTSALILNFFSFSGRHKPIGSHDTINGFCTAVWSNFKLYVQGKRAFCNKAKERANDLFCLLSVEEANLLSETKPRSTC